MILISLISCQKKDKPIEKLYNIDITVYQQDTSAIIPQPVRNATVILQSNNYYEYKEVIEGNCNFKFNDLKENIYDCTVIGKITTGSYNGQVRNKTLKLYLKTNYIDTIIVKKE
jgi:hypothetical protein